MISIELCLEKKTHLSFDVVYEASNWGDLEEAIWVATHRVFPIAWFIHQLYVIIDILQEQLFVSAVTRDDVK